MLIFVNAMEIKRYCVVSSAGVVFEAYGWHGDWASACTALRRACADHPLAGCRILYQHLVVAGGDAQLERRNRWRRSFEYFRGRRR